MTASTSLYGLDLDLVKSLQLDDFLEEKKQSLVTDKSTSVIDKRDLGARYGDDILNKTMTELRLEHGLEPGLHSAASRLRMRCSFYQNTYADSGKGSDQDN